MNIEMSKKKEIFIKHLSIIMHFKKMEKKAKYMIIERQKLQYE
jgi:hypothetical protein